MNDPWVICCCCSSSSSGGLKGATLCQMPLGGSVVGDSLFGECICTDLLSDDRMICCREDRMSSVFIRRCLLYLAENNHIVNCWSWKMIRSCLAGKITTWIHHSWYTTVDGKGFLNDRNMLFKGTKSLSADENGLVVVCADQPMGREFLTVWWEEDSQETQ